MNPDEHSDTDATPPTPPQTDDNTGWSDLVAALGALAEPVKGGKVNAGQRNYTYLTLPDLLDAVRPVLAAHNFAVMQDTWREGDTVLCETTLQHTSGWARTSARPLTQRCGPGVQDLGSAITYLRRYQLGQMVGLAGTDDDDGQAAQKATPDAATEPPPAKPKGYTKPTDPVSKAQLTMIHTLLKEQGITDREQALQLLASFARIDALKSSKDLTIAQGSMVISELKALTEGPTDAATD